ncbi:MAG: hypothetical protein SPJ25_08300 [Prevotella sp.]|nr:hypothetical protein [Prevotella sp.]
MGIEYSTPLVALTSAWFYISGEIVQISIRQKPKRRKRLSSHQVLRQMSIPETMPQVSITLLPKHEE